MRSFKRDLTAIGLILLGGILAVGSVVWIMNLMLALASAATLLGVAQ